MGMRPAQLAGRRRAQTAELTFRVYGVAQDDGPSFSNAAGNTPLDVPYTASYDDYMTTGPGDAHGSCQGNNNGQNTCIHIIDVTNIVKEITSRSGMDECVCHAVCSVEHERDCPAMSMPDLRIIPPTLPERPRS